MNAIISGKLELCKFLIFQEDVNLNIENLNGESAITKAFYHLNYQRSIAPNIPSCNERYKILELLVKSEKLDLKQVVSRSNDELEDLSVCFNIIIEQENLDKSFLGKLIEVGFNLNDLNSYSGSLYFHDLIFVIGCQPSEKAFNILSELLARKIIGINQSDKHGTTVLMDAVANGQLELCKFLISQEDVDLNTENLNGKSAITKAFFYHDNQKDLYPNTLFCIESYEILKLLVESKKLDINKVFSDGSNPLILACFNGYADIVKILINKGANIDNTKVPNSEDLKMLEALCISTLEKLDCIIPYSTLSRHSNLENISQETKDFFEDEENMVFKLVPGAYFVLKVLTDQSKLEKCIELIPDFLILLENAKAAIGFLDFSLESKVDKILGTYLVLEEDNTVDVGNVEVIPELAGVVKDFDENIEG